MPVYRVGERYSPTKKIFPEGVDYNFRGGQHELRLFYRTPSPREIKEIKTGKAKFAMSIMGDLIVFLYKFGDLNWGDCGFSFHKVPANEQVLPTETPADHALLSVLLIDAETGIIKVIRSLTFSPKFTQALHAAIRAQADKPLPEDYMAQIAQVYRKYTSEDLAMRHADARCRGGE